MSQLEEITSSNARNEVNFYLYSEYSFPPTFQCSETEALTDVYVQVDEDGITEDERKQVEESRKNIAAGRTKRFKNAEEYLKSLDEDQK